MTHRFFAYFKWRYRYNTVQDNKTYFGMKCSQFLSKLLRHQSNSKVGKIHGKKYGNFVDPRILTFFTGALTLSGNSSCNRSVLNVVE